MEKILNYIRLLGMYSGYMLIIILFSTILNYFTSLSANAISTINIITLGCLCIFIGFKQGYKSVKKGWQCGIITGSVFVVNLLIISLILFTKNLRLSSFIYYGILLIFVVVGSILGKNKKKEN